MKLIIISILLLVLGSFPNFQFSNDLKTRIKEQLPSGEINQKVDLKAVAIKSDIFGSPLNNSAAALVSDFDSNYVYFEKNSDKRLPMASTTKIMTAIIAIEKLKADQIIEVKQIQNRPLDVTMGLSVGDKIRTTELLHGLLIESAADASRVLATAAAGSEEEFVALMNEFAQKFEITDTQFTNSVGYDDYGHYTTASDLTKLTKIALLNPLISEIVSKPSYVAKSENSKSYYLSNTNKFLSNPRIKGVKTGTTLNAGECLVALYREEELKIITVVFDSPNRFQETESLLSWTKSAFTW